MTEAPTTATSPSPGTSAEPVIEVRGVHLSFPLVRFQPGGVKEAFLALVRGQRRPKEETEFWALRGIDLEIRRGEVVGVIGKNGSGKSTLLRVIGGIYAPDRGTALARGRIASLELGSGFREELTGYENIRLSGAIMGFSPRQIAELIDGIVEFSGLERFIHQPLRTYSSGMKLRLGFSVASVIQPEILLIDEVLAVGDAEFREKSMARMEEMVSGDATVVIVTHSMEDLRRLCTRAILLADGKVLADGAPEDVIAAYAKK